MTAVDRRTFVAATTAALAAAARAARPATAAVPEANGRTWRVDAARLEQRLKDLSRFGANPQGGVSRVAFSPADVEGRAFVMEMMRGGRPRGARRSRRQHPGPPARPPADAAARSCSARTSTPFRRAATTTATWAPWPRSRWRRSWARRGTATGTPSRSHLVRRGERAHRQPRLRGRHPPGGAGAPRPATARFSPRTSAASAAIPARLGAARHAEGLRRRLPRAAHRAGRDPGRGRHPHRRGGGDRRHPPLRGDGARLRQPRGHHPDGQAAQRPPGRLRDRPGRGPHRARACRAGRWAPSDAWPCGRARPT